MSQPRRRASWGGPVGQVSTGDAPPAAGPAGPTTPGALSMRTDSLTFAQTTTVPGPMVQAARQDHLRSETPSLPHVLWGFGTTSCPSVSSSSSFSSTIVMTREWPSLTQLKQVDRDQVQPTSELTSPQVGTTIRDSITGHDVGMRDYFRWCVGDNVQSFCSRPISSVTFSESRKMQDLFGIVGSRPIPASKYS